MEYKRNWMQHVNRMPRNRLPRVTKYYSPTGRRNHGRPLKRLLDTWDRNGSTSGPAPWQIYDDNNDPIYVLLEGCLTMHLPHEITWNANLMQHGDFINVFLARHVSGTYAHHQEHSMLSCSIWFSAPSFWMRGGLENRCVGRVYGADGATSASYTLKPATRIPPQLAIPKLQHTSKQEHTTNVVIQ